MREDFNLNKCCCIIVSDFDFGKAKKIVKISRNYYILEIDKDCDSTFVCLGKIGGREKWGFKTSLVGMTRVSNNAVLDKEFLLNIGAIEKAQRLIEKYKYILK